MRPIDAYALRIDRDDFDTYADYIRVFDMIAEAPTVHAEPVIRCRECRYHHGRWCQIFGVDHLIVTNEDDYCSYAEREDNA